jgi:tetratricopeptide (TPR) repeat protein
MESYRLNSKVVSGDREYMIQTVNDSEQMSVVTSVFSGGEMIDVARLPHPQQISAEEILTMVKTTHDEKTDELDRLLKTFRMVLESGNAETMHHLGTAFYYKRMYDEARTLFTKALEDRPEFHQAANFLGLTCLALGEDREAIKAFDKAVQLRPSYADYRNNHGEALLKGGFCRKAVEEFEAALKQNIYYADAYFNLGIAYITNAVMREDFELFANLLEKTTDMVNRAVLIAPDYRCLELDQAREALKNGDLPRALNLYQAARNQRRETQRQEFSGFYSKFLVQSEWVSERIITDRIAFLETEINKNPTYVDLHHELAICYLQQARFVWRKGTEQFRKTIEINPRLVKARSALEKTKAFYTEIEHIVDRLLENGQEG